jgi:hypothetical protein
MPSLFPKAYPIRNRRKAMELEAILKVVFLGILHWMLVSLAMRDLATRQGVLGGRKAPWIVAIVLVTWVGSLSYLLIHSQIPDQVASPSRASVEETVL